MIINRILQNLKKPFEIPKKIIKKIIFLISLKKYNQKIFEIKQENIFNSLDLNREQGTQNLNKILDNASFDLDDNKGMSSEHEVLFSSLSLKKNIKIVDILEIGTFNGFNALLLSRLFPLAKIDTIDLPEKDPDFINYYNRKFSIQNFIKKRNNYILQSKNINFLEFNSIKLLNHKKKYDLIWIDGAHGYPTVCIDIINSLKLINEGGLILCDDIYCNLKNEDLDRMYISNASYETLNELQKQNLINFKLIYKRLSPESNCVKRNRKFIAIVNKT